VADQAVNQIIDRPVCSGEMKFHGPPGSALS
jgi:hypothetical protein